MKFTMFFSANAAVAAVRANAKVKPGAKLRLFYWELESMDEYSTSVPTGVVVGKFWKCNHNAMRRGKRPDWTVRAYGHCEDPKYVSNFWFEILLCEGPRPPDWSAPDWSYYEGWKRQYAAQRKAGVSALDAGA